MFDLETDPQEMKSIQSDPKYAPVLAALQQRHRELKKFYDVNFANIPATRGDEEWWNKRDREKREQAKAGDFELVFIGDSITQGWEGNGKAVWEKYYGDRKALNLGFGGDRTEGMADQKSRPSDHLFQQAHHVRREIRNTIVAWRVVRLTVAAQIQ